MKNKNGFTLIEIIVSVAILSIVMMFILTATATVIKLYLDAKNLRTDTHTLTSYMTLGSNTPDPTITNTMEKDIKISLVNGAEKKMSGTIDIRIEEKDEVTLKTFQKK